MNIVEIIAENKCCIKSFDTKICNCFVSIRYSRGEIIVTTKSKKSVEKIESILLDIFSMFFIYQGFYPTIKSIKCNGIACNRDLVGKYFTSKQFKRISHSVIEINENTLCDAVYKKYKELCGTYIYSFEYLCSECYEGITCNHKIMLLLHCLEGYIINSKYEQLREKAVPKGIEGKFGKRISFVLKVLFYYDKKFKAELLKLLKVSKKKMIDILSDTRNENSHNLSTVSPLSKNLALKDGGYMIYYFYILYYIYRVFIVKELDLDVDEDKVKCYLYEIHDWLDDNLYNGKYDYKSSLYITIRSMQRLDTDKN